jgi:hypothetical protein
LARDALVDSYPMQPRGNLGFTAEGAQVPERREKGLLSRVTRILFASEHAKGKREDSSLPALHNLAESLRVARQSTFYDLLVARSRSLPVWFCEARCPRFRSAVPAI